MVTYAVEGYHLMDNYPSRNCHSDLMDDVSYRSCLGVIFPEEPHRPGDWEPFQIAERYWTCCRD